jgi:hypothetical protein
MKIHTKISIISPNPALGHPPLNGHQRVPLSHHQPHQMDSQKSHPKDKGMGRQLTTASTLPLTLINKASPIQLGRGAQRARGRDQSCPLSPGRGQVELEKKQTWELQVALGLQTSPLPLYTTASLCKAGARALSSECQLCSLDGHLRPKPIVISSTGSTHSFNCFQEAPGECFVCFNFPFHFTQCY